MGMAGRRFANTKNGRAVVIAILEEWSLIGLAAVSTGAMIMVAVMLYNDWSASAVNRPCASWPAFTTQALIFVAIVAWLIGLWVAASPSDSPQHLPAST